MKFYFGGAVSSLNGSLMYGGYLGFYSKGFNMEFFYMMGNDKSDKIYWNTLHYMQRPSMHVYAPTEMGARLGWGILLGRGARLTPQVGAGYMKLDTVENERGYYDAGKTCDALSFKAGMKLSIALGGCMELNVMPEFSSMIMKSNVYESLCNASSVIEGWGNGFAINAGIGFYF